MSGSPGCGGEGRGARVRVVGPGRRRVETGTEGGRLLEGRAPRGGRRGRFVEEKKE